MSVEVAIIGDRSMPSGADAADGVRPTDRTALLAEADVVILHARVTAETTGSIDAEAFARMKPGAIFVDTARRPLVDDAAPHDALASGRPRGAMLESFAVEPAPPDRPLLRLPDVTPTPHIAGASVETVTIAAARAAEEVRRRLDGLPPLNPC